MIFRIHKLISSVASLAALLPLSSASYAIQRIPIENWGYKLVNEAMGRCFAYLEESARDLVAQKEDEHFYYFRDAWKYYLELRKITELDQKPVFPVEYGVMERDAFYTDMSWSGWGGSSGHDR